MGGMEGFLMRMVGGGSVEWNGLRRTVRYEGEDYVVMGDAMRQDLQGSPMGLFVMRREEYANRRAGEIRFIAGEFLIDVYPGVTEESAFTIPQLGCAADEDADESHIDLAVAETERNGDPLQVPVFDRLRNRGRYPYPELSEVARMYLDLDIQLSVTAARAKAISEGEPEEEVDRLMSEAGDEARKRKEEWIASRTSKPKKGKGRKS